MIDDDLYIQEYNEPPTRIVEAPVQHLAPAIRQMASRNRTRCATETRMETMNLLEIDREATLAGDGQLNQEALMILNVTRTGSTCTKDKTYKAGKSDDAICVYATKKRSVVDISGPAQVL